MTGLETHVQFKSKGSSGQLDARGGSLRVPCYHDQMIAHFSATYTHVLHALCSLNLGYVSAAAAAPQSPIVCLPQNKKVYLPVLIIYNKAKGA
ncbi:hypothetical protein VTP01DRAFT_2268 [Rhizomucor pusillus]|uniref:uncharacterized protein n=1 Tax=Rhizomucor pusillus TaxID=4840 RepID=UPI0037438D09